MSDAPPQALRIRDLRQRFKAPDGGTVEALHVPTLDLERGGSLAVEGESGSGKTTLLHVVAGILPVQEGRVEVLGEPLHGRGELARDRLRARHVGYLFQTFNLLPHLSAVENVALGSTFRPGGAAGRMRAARQALDRVGLSERLHHRPGQLSVGQQQRVAIARALTGRPGLVLADEPTSNLDARRAAESLDLLRAFAGECDAALLVVTHDERVLAQFEHRLHLVTPAGASA